MDFSPQIAFRSPLSFAKSNQWVLERGVGGVKQKANLLMAQICHTILPMIPVEPSDHMI